MVVLSVTLAACRFSREAEQRNVLLIIADDLRPSIRAMGDPVALTPNMDRIVEEGQVFQRAYAQYANCSPSRISILTGLSPETTGHRGNLRSKMAFEDHETLPGFFKSHGYTTASFGKVYHDALDDRDSWDHYYDVGDYLNAPWEVPWEGYADPENQKLEGLDRPATEMTDRDINIYNDHQILSAALATLEQKKREPFFMAVGFRKPHLPFAAPIEYWNLYDRDEININDIPQAPVNGDTIVYQWSELDAYKYYGVQYRNSNYRNASIPVDRVRELRHGYYACVSYIDGLIGELMMGIEDHNLKKNTIVVLIGDHGYHLGDQQIWGKHSSYDLSTHVPLIIVDPSRPGARYEQQFVQLLDLYPTLAQLANLPLPEKLDGRSLVPLLRDPDLPGYEAAFSQYQSFQKEREFSDYMGYAIYTDRYNYIEWQDLKSNRQVVQRELYSMDKSRIERLNIATADEVQDDIKQLSSVIKKHFSPFRNRAASAGGAKHEH